MRPVLNLGFHGIGSPEGRDFGDGERDFWATPELLEATLDAATDRPDIAISFDDGNRTDIDIALPALTERGLSATFFIVPSWLGRPGSIDEDGVRMLADSGMTIGNHGLAHLRWTALTTDQLTHEVVDARRRLEQLSGTPIATLAIPYGDYDDAVLASVGEFGYDHVFTSDGGTADSTAWLQAREHIRANHTPADLEQLLAV